MRYSHYQKSSSLLWGAGIEINVLVLKMYEVRLTTLANELDAAEMLEQVSA